MDFIEWLKQSWLFITIIAGALTTVLGLRKNIKSLIEDIRKPIKNANEKLENIEKTVNSNTQKLEMLNASVASNTTQLGKIDTTLKVQNEALLGLEKAAVINSCETFIKQGYADVHHRNTLDKQYASYMALGNGSQFVDDLVTTVKKLPLERSKAKKQQSNE